MSKRIKRVFSSKNQVLHLWANQSQSDARCRNVFFEGKSVYSYGHHYELGRLVEYNGVTVAMINTQGYSMTTSGHINAAFHAVEHLPNLGTKSNLNDVRQALVDKQDEIISTLFDHFNRRTFWHDSKWDQYDENNIKNIKDFNALAKLLGHPELALDVNFDFIQIYNEYIQERLEREKYLNSPEMLAQKEEKKQKALERQKIKQAALVLEWKRGGPSFKGLANVSPQIFRIQGNEIHTSRGAIVPLQDAKNLMAKIMKSKAKTGDKIGAFNLTSIQNDIVRIGCHTFSLSEAKDILAGVL